MWSLMQWQPGCWCAAVLKLCDQHIVWENEDQGTRYPDQWMFSLWRPMRESKPFIRPDAWGLTIGHPREELRNLVGDAANVYMLQDGECLWSSWLTIPQVCDRYEPWLTTAIEETITTQRAAERARYLQWYGSEQMQFNQFLKKVLPK